ncbi:MAG: YbaK/EbsC family protein [Burkholderiaceae bacterium]
MNALTTDTQDMPAAVRRVVDTLAAMGHPHNPVMLDAAARTAQEAADALGVALGQIAKSIVFRRKSDDAAVLVVTSGDLRVDEKKVQALVCTDGARLGRADADFVKTSTGFSIGGVSPVGHVKPPVTLIDAQLLRFEEIWAAAGHPHAVFRLSPGELRELTGAPVADVTQTP